MCKCNSEIKMPFCGKGDCVWPIQEINGECWSTGGPETWIYADNCLGDFIVPSVWGNLTIFTFSDKDGNEVLKITPDGEIFVKGNKITTDKEVYTGLVELLSSHNCYRNK
jgi:hypothetical protein